MNLNEGGSWLNEGDYLTTVESLRDITAKTGSQGYEYVFRDKATDGKVKQGYWHTDSSGKPSGARWRLRELAASCGCTEAELENFDPEMILGRDVGIRVKKDGDYSEVDQTYPAAEFKGVTTKDNQEDAAPSTDGGLPPVGDDSNIPF